MNMNTSSIESYQLGHTNRRGEKVLKKYTILLYEQIIHSFSENLHGKIFIWHSLKMNIIIFITNEWCTY